MALRWDAVGAMSRAGLGDLVAQLDAEQRGLRETLTLSFTAARGVRVIRIQRKMRRRKEVANLLEQCKDNAHGHSWLN
jgi:hypothetical protein